MTAEERVLDSLLRSADRDAGRKIARHRHRFLVRGSRACRPGRQRHRRRLSDAPARGQGGPGQDRRRSGSPAKSTPCGRRWKRPRPRSRISAPSPIFWSAPTTPRCRRRTLGDVNAQLAAARAQKADAEAKAKMIRDMLRPGQPIELSDILNSELDSPARRAARHLARPARRAIGDAARRASADHRVEGPDRRSRQSDQGRGGHHRALVRERRQACRRAGRYAHRKPRSAQEPGGDDQRAGRAIARA